MIYFIDKYHIKKRRSEYYKIINKSGQFDSEYYKETYNIIASQDLLWHYIINGEKYNYNPNNYFDTTWYLNNNPDVKEAKIHPFIHYLTHGAEEGRATRAEVTIIPEDEQHKKFSEHYRRKLEKKNQDEIIDDEYSKIQKYHLFDERYYRFNNPDLSDVDDLLKHFLLEGLPEGRNPSSHFSIIKYLMANPDVVLSGENPLIHHISDKQKYPYKPLVGEEGHFDALFQGDLPIVTSKFDDVISPVDVIVPIYNGIDQLNNLLPTLITHTSKRHRIILINDSSTDYKVQNLLVSWQQKHEKIILISNDENLGFIKTVNKGMSMSDRHVILLNSDTMVGESWVENIISRIERNPNIATVTPFANTSSLTGFPEVCSEVDLDDKSDFELIAKAFSSIDSPDITIPSGAGFCIGINREVINRIGLFDDEDYEKGYYEETDWCLRARGAGYKHVIAPNAFVYHEPGSKSFTVEQRIALSSKNEAIFKDRWPYFHDEKHNYYAQDPAAPIRVLVKMLLLSMKSSKTNVILEHNWGGGAQHFADRLVQKLNNEDICTIRVSLNSQNAKLSISYLDDNYIISLSNNESLWRFVSYLNPDKLIYNSLASDFSPLITLERIMRYFPRGVEIHCLFHDFLPLCPSINLLNTIDKYCGLPNDKKCEDCFSKFPADKRYKQLKISDWRHSWRAFLGRSDEVICFSNNSRESIGKIYPSIQNKILIKPHKIEYSLREVNIKPNDKLVVGVIGHMFPHKGGVFVRDFSCHLDKINAESMLIILGTIDDEIEDTEKLHVTGEYQHDKLPDMIEKHGVNVILFPSICPETFSFVLSEVFMMRLPVVCLPLGSQQERVTDYDLGVVSPSFEFSDVYLSLCSAKNKILLGEQSTQESTVPS